jgi:molybdopterin molybdotransferase
MIAVSEALNLIHTHIAPLGTEEIRLDEALHRRLAGQLISEIDMPPFPQSAMDGYAMHLHPAAEYEVIGEIKAGDASDIALQPGQATRIFTGAMVPASANCVVRQEIVQRDGDRIVVNGTLIPGENIRPQGEQIQRGELVFPAGTFINPGVIGHLATLGFTHVKVYRNPRIALITTGNELQTPGTPLEAGKIYESNSIMLRSALRARGLDCTVYFVKDDYAATSDLISHCLDEVDLLLLSGGISVGEYDFVARALSELGVECHFHKIRQKPGKPLYFGSRGTVSIFALPGNPAAALTCLYVYVYKALDHLQTVCDCRQNPSVLPLKDAFRKKTGLTHFLKGKIVQGEIQVLSGQSSAMLSAFSEANCLVVAEEDREEWQAGDSIVYLPLPL